MASELLQVTERVVQSHPDTDQMLFYLPLTGSTFKKVYFDQAKQRAVSKFVPAEDLVVPYSASDLMTAERVTHVVKMSYNDIRKLQVAGVYRDVELSTADSGEDEGSIQGSRVSGGKAASSNTSYPTRLELALALLENYQDTDFIQQSMKTCVCRRTECFKL